MLLSTETYMPLSNNCDEEAIRLIAEAGFDALDYSMFGMRKEDHFLNHCDVEAYARQLKEKIIAAGLVCNQAHAAFHFEGEGDLSRIQCVENGIKIAGILGAKTICVHPVPYSRDPRETKDRNLEMYRHLGEIAKAYGTLLLCNLVINLALLAIERTDNPNNAAIFSMAGENLRRTAAVAVFLAPLVEEPMFRGGVFGLLRRYNRIAAYGASMLLFAVYHVWSFAASDPTAWLYVLQYLPAGFLLARVYEKTISIWTGIFLHMTVNGVSMLLVSALGAYL